MQFLNYNMCSYMLSLKDLHKLWVVWHIQWTERLDHVSSGCLQEVNNYQQKIIKLSAQLLSTIIWMYWLEFNLIWHIYKLKTTKCKRYFDQHRVRKYAKIVQMTPQRLRKESLWLQKFSVTNRETLRLQKFSVTNTVFSQQIQFTLIVNVINLN